MLEISEGGRLSDDRPILADYREGIPAVDPRVGPLAGSLFGESRGARGIDTAELGHCIRTPEHPRQSVCPHCCESLRVAGPTGYENGEPICDLCLLERCEELGMLLVLASAIRAFATYRAEDGERYRRALGELGVVARVYERLAARSGPPRPFRIPARMGGPTEAESRPGD